MDFDCIIDRRNSHSMKWDMMEARYGVPLATGLPMWVADMDFRAPDCVLRALQDQVDHGVYGYFGDERPYRDAICWWMDTRHGWQVDPNHIFTTHGLVNGTALCLQAFTAPGDGVVLFTPVYHAFARVIRAAGREVIECPLVEDDGKYCMDLQGAAASLPANARMVILCSPHNPGGRVWSVAELRELADFARAHDLILVSDEIHHDLVMPGHRHVAMPVAAPDCADRLVMLTAASKSFNLAGVHVGNVIIADAGLRARFAGVMAAMGISPNSLGLHMVTAAYSSQGADWLDALNEYLDTNRAHFEAGVNAIPGLRAMQLQATYLSWIDFSGTGMARDEFTRRVEGTAQIAANHGPTFGTGGESWLRFNLATPRARIDDALRRLQVAFGDLQ